MLNVPVRSLDNFFTAYSYDCCDVYYLKWNENVFYKCGWKLNSSYSFCFYLNLIWSFGSLLLLVPLMFYWAFQLFLKNWEVQLCHCYYSVDHLGQGFNTSRQHTVKCKPVIVGWLVSLYCCLPKWLWCHRVLWLCNSGSQWPQIEIHLKSHQLWYQPITNKEIRDTYQHNLDMLAVLHSVFTTGLFSLVKHLEGIQVKALSWLMSLIMVLLLCSNWNCVLRAGERSVRQSNFPLLRWHFMTIMTF